MAGFACPKCRADIQPDLIETTGKAECPFCGADLSAMGLPQPAPARTAADSMAEAAAEQATGEFSARPQGPARELPRVPPKSRIKVVESTADRIVLYVPGGGKQAASLGCFATFWLVIVGAVSSGVLFGAGQGAAGLGLLAFLSIFWGIGLVVAGFALKMRFERTFLLLDKERIVVQRVLFNRRRMEETALPPGARAELVESYKQNDQPVYRIEIRGKPRPARFGTGLTEEEKDWIVDRINEFLGVAAGPATLLTAASAPAPDATGAAVAAVPGESCTKCGAPLAGKVMHGVIACANCGAIFRLPPIAAAPAALTAVPKVERLDPASLPSNGAIQVDENSPEVLQFHYPALPESPWRWLVPLFLLPLMVVWGFFIYQFAADAAQIGVLPVKILFLAMLVPVFLVGLVPFSFGLLAVRGTTTVRLTRDTLTCRWHVGRFGRSKSLPVEMIDRVRAISMAHAADNPRVRGAIATRPDETWQSCVACASGRKLLLTLIQDGETARQIAALVRTRLEDWGRVVADV